MRQSNCGTKFNSENFSAWVLRQLQFISQYSTDCEYVRSEENPVADVLTGTGVALIHNLNTPLDFAKIADAQNSDSEIQTMCNQTLSLQIKGIPVDGTKKVILCEVSQAGPRIFYRLHFDKKLLTLFIFSVMQE